MDAKALNPAMPANNPLTIRLMVHPFLCRSMTNARWREGIGPRLNTRDSNRSGHPATTTYRVKRRQVQASWRLSDIADRRSRLFMH